MEEEYSDDYLKHLKESKKAIQEIELDEYKESLDTIDAIKNRMVTDTISTNRNRENFIKDMKEGLGDEIKNNIGKIEYIERPWYYKVGAFFKKLFKTI